LDYVALLARLGSLNAVGLTDASVDSRVSFWLNVYHLLLLVSFVECFPYTGRDRASNHLSCGLHVCGEVLSLGDIEHCILRANKLGKSLPNIPKSILASIPASAVPHALW
jgi:hypothetical protein